MVVRNKASNVVRCSGLGDGPSAEPFAEGSELHVTLIHFLLSFFSLHIRPVFDPLIILKRAGEVVHITVLYLSHNYDVVSQYHPVSSLLEPGGGGHM